MGDKFVLAKIPVVIGEDATQVLIDQQFGLETPAVKVMDVDTSIRDMVVHIVPNKVVVQAVLHKQIFFITEENIVRHQAENIPFSAVIPIPGAQPSMHAQVKVTVEEPIFFRLLNSVTLEQKIVICVLVKVTEERQLFVKAIPKEKFEELDSIDSTLVLTQLADGFAKFQVALAKGDRATCLKYLDAAADSAKKLAGNLLCPGGADILSRVLEELKKNL
ncbi:MAG: DUF3794 domain-containing protein [Bacillota bacterium]